jgi:protein SCO1/2
MLTLAFPVLIFLFLKIFTTNHYDLPYYVPMIDSVSNAVVMNEGDTVFYQLNDFSLITTSNEPLTSDQLRGKMMVLSSIRLANVDGYDKVLGELVRINKLSESYPELIILTLIPEKENGIKTELEKRRVVSELWKVISVTDSSQYEYVDKIFHLSEKAGIHQTISSNNRLSLVDASGYTRGYYNALDPEDIDRLMAEIKILDYSKNLKE